jgi:hypothetical protein
MLADGDKEGTVNQTESEGWGEEIGRRADRMLGLVFLVLIGFVLVVSAWLFLSEG